ncbi:hypothetical protein ACMFMG_004944 [Clarireedia jacksonii]
MVYAVLHSEHNSYNIRSFPRVIYDGLWNIDNLSSEFTNEFHTEQYQYAWCCALQSMFWWPGWVSSPIASKYIDPHIFAVLDSFPSELAQNLGFEGFKKSSPRAATYRSPLTTPPPSTRQKEPRNFHVDRAILAFAVRPSVSTLASWKLEAKTSPKSLS